MAVLKRALIQNVKPKMKHCSGRFLIFLMLICFFPASCSESQKPPYFTAEVVNVYHEKTVVEQAQIVYWWEERGETPFLKPYTHAAKEFISETMLPSGDASGRVTMQTVSIPFKELLAVDSVLTDEGKKIIIKTKDGREITTQKNFPRVLKKDPAAGLADYKIFVQGKYMQGNERMEFKQEIDFIKHLAIIGSSIDK